MFYLFTVLIVIVSVLLILVVLVQNPKGGGLSSTFAGSNQIMGVRKTADFLEKATWSLAISLLVFSFLATMTVPKSEVDRESIIKEQVQSAMDKNVAPSMPTNDKQNQTVQPEKNPTTTPNQTKDQNKK